MVFDGVCPDGSAFYSRLNAATNSSGDKVPAVLAKPHLF